MKRLLTGILLMGIVVAPAMGLAEEQLIQEVSANGTRNLRPFTVENDWEIRWAAEGQILRIVVHPQGDNQDDPMVSIPQVAANQRGPGGGSSYMPNGGRYYLQIVASGDWTVKVVQLDEP